MQRCRECDGYGSLFVRMDGAIKIRRWCETCNGKGFAWPPETEVAQRPAQERKPVAEKEG